MNEFIICETCLGPNPYIRMTKLPLGNDLCKISGSVFQCFMWKVDGGGRVKKCIISHSVAKERNICQVCLLDMKWGLPVGARDQILAQLGKSIKAAPDSVAGSAYHYGQIESGQAKSNAGALTVNDEALLQTQEGQQLIKMAQARANSEKSGRTAFRNLPKLCSFWVAGTCTRCVKGLCQFRPCCGPTSFEFPELAATHKELRSALIARLQKEGPLEVMKTLDTATRKALQDSGRGVNTDEEIRSRVAGTDGMSKAVLSKLAPKERALQPPADQTITTLWLGNVSPDLTDVEVKNSLYAGGAFKDMHIMKKAKCAFVEYATRAAAESAAVALHQKLNIRGTDIQVKWAKPATKKQRPPPPPPPLPQGESSENGKKRAAPPQAGAQKKAKNE